jgi:type VI secretion system secreted protein VgrG
MRTGFKQTNAALSIMTPFGADELLLDSFQGTESLSQPFRFMLSMRSSSNTLEPATIIGASVTVSLAPAGGTPRFFHGIVARFLHAGSDGAFALYSAELVPSLWLLTLSRDRKIYQNKTAVDIVKTVLGDFGVTFEADHVTGTYPIREYCVQFDETPLDFISRLMEEEGIFYFFSFADGRHTMVLGDNPSAHEDCTGAGTLRYFGDQGGRRMVDIVTQLEYDSRLVVQNFARSDFNYLEPSTALLTESAGISGKGTQFDYPGKHDVLADGTQRAKVRVQASQVDGAVCRGTSYCYMLSAGKQFMLSGHPRNALNTSLVLRSVTHTASHQQYTNSFEAFAASIPFRPPRVSPLPRVAGSQTALVVGPSGEEIWTDQHGRIKVQFHWDRVGANDENSSCWVRVSQLWAGLSWGALFLPRIGQEVVISCVDGDPDRPLVTGCVYNAENTTPVTLPGMQTQSTIKSRSSKQGGAGNEMRMEDKKDAEEFYFHAQKDMKVEIENDLATTLIAGAETHTVKKGDRTVDVQTGKETHKVKGTRDLTITGKESHTNQADFQQDVTGNYQLTVSGNLVIDVSGSVSIKSGTTFTVEAGTSLSSKAGTSLSNKAGTSLDNEAGTALKNKGGASLDNEAPLITSKASATQTVDGGGMLTLKGGLVKIN